MKIENWVIYFLKKFIQHILKFFAKIYLSRANPRVIVIAGTTNRHWIKEKITEALNEKKLKCRANKKNFNAEIGLPISVLGLPSAEGKGVFKRWLKTLKGAYYSAFYGEKADFLVLETAIDKPDDMKYLLEIIKPRVAVFTTITMIYPENFDNLDEIAVEYKKLIKALPPNGLAILNADDSRISQLKNYAKCKIITYGIENKNADYLAENIQKTTIGQEFKLHLPDMGVENIITERFGAHHIYAELVKRIINDNLIK